MIDWDDPATWRCPLPGHLSVPDMLGPVIQHIFPDEWNGRERDVWLPPDDAPGRDAWREAAQRRLGAFMVMQRGAADGSLPFCVYDPDACALLPLPASVWACQPGVATARFLRGAFSVDYPNHAAPREPAYLLHFNSTFVFNLYVPASDLVLWLRERVSPVEQVDDDPHGIAARDAMLLAAIAPREPPADMMPPPPLPPLKPGDRGGRYDWTGAEAALSDWDFSADIFAEVIANKPGGPRQADIERYMHKWFADRRESDGDRLPGESTVRDRVGALLQHRRESMAAQASRKGQ